MKISEFEKLKELIRNYIQLLEKEYFCHFGNTVFQHGFFLGLGTNANVVYPRDLNKLESW